MLRCTTNDSETDYGAVDRTDLINCCAIFNANDIEGVGGGAMFPQHTAC